MVGRIYGSEAVIVALGVAGVAFALWLAGGVFTSLTGTMGMLSIVAAMYFQRLPFAFRVALNIIGLALIVASGQLDLEGWRAEMAKPSPYHLGKPR